VAGTRDEFLLEEMPFILKPERSIRRRLTHVLRQQLRRGEQNLQSGRASGVYEARKNVKKARAVVAMLDEAGAGSIGKDARRLRDAAHALAPLRDADAMVATLDRLRSHFPRRLPEHTFALLRRHLVREKTRTSRSAKVRRQLARAARTLHAVRRSAKAWRVPTLHARELPKLVRPAYRSSRKTMRQAHDEMDPAALHRWRRRVKTLWYQLRLTEPFMPSLRRDVQGLGHLAQWLGDVHNLTLLQTAIETNEDIARRVPAAVREVAAMCATDQVKLCSKAFALGRRLLRHRPKAFEGRMRRALSTRASTPARTLRRKAAA
jgi:CHAD domain-containing protein